MKTTDTLSSRIDLDVRRTLASDEGDLAQVERSEESALQVWGQPPARQMIYFFSLAEYGEVIKGVYVTTGAANKLATELDLAQEFKAWEAASDEDFWMFEKGLDS